MKYKELKEELKASAKEIRKMKGERKTSRCGLVYGLHERQWVYRHKHIIYCLLRGRTMEQIEPKVREGNEPSKYLLNKFREEYEKAVCDSGCKIEEETPSTPSSSCSGPTLTGQPELRVEKPNSCDSKEPELERSFVSGVLNICRHILG